MPRQQRKRRKKPAVQPVSSRRRSSAPTPPRKKAWTVLIYMCGDNDLESFIDDDFAELCRVGSSPDIHLVVQRDRREGARRYIFPEGRCDGEPVCDATLDNVRVNTGEPSEAVKFLLWGLEHAPSERVAVIFSGLGISPSYVRQRLLLSSEVIEEQAIDAQIQQQLFSICHDVTSHDALEASELRQVLARLKEKLNDSGTSERLIDLVRTRHGGGSVASKSPIKWRD